MAIKYDNIELQNIKNEDGEQCLSFGTDQVVTSTAALHAPVYYDSSATAYYLDQAAQSRLNTLLVGNSPASGVTSGYFLQLRGAGIHMTNNPIHYASEVHFQSDVRFKDGGNDQTLHLKFGDASVADLQIRDGNNNYDGSVYAESGYIGTLSPDGSWAVQSSNSITNISHEVRSPKFVDQDNTNYYANLAATSDNSTAVSLKVRQTVVIGDSGTYNLNDGGWGARLIVSDNVHSRIDVAQDANSMRSSWYAHTGHGGAYFGTVTSGHHQYFLSGNTQALVLDGSNQAATFAGNLILTGNSSITSGGYLHLITAGGANTYLDAGGTVYIRDVDSGNADRVTIDTSNGNTVFAGTVTGQNFYGNQFHDSQDTAFYVNPASQSILRKTVGERTNLATSEGWAETNAWSVGTQTGYFGGNFTINGSSDENNICYEIGPGTTHASGHGGRCLVWKIKTNSSDSGADGGWNKTITNINVNRGHMSVIYVKRVGNGNGNFYHGTSTCLNLSDGSSNGNPYFTSGGAQSLPSGVWCVSIGYLQANNDTAVSASDSFSGIYRLDTGERIIGNTDYRMSGGTTTTQHRTFLYYATNTNTELWLAKPGFYEMNGSEPTISDLLMRPESRVDSLRADNDMRAPILYDSDQTSYYCNPSSTGNFNGLTTNGTTTFNAATTFNPDGDSQLWIGNAGTDALGIYGGAGDTVYVGGNNTWQMYFTTNNYCYSRTWINLGSGAGIFSTTNGFHFYPNGNSSYGAAMLQGSRNGYFGIQFYGCGGTGDAAQHLMGDSAGNIGIWSSSNSSGWPFYFHRSNFCIGIGASTTSSSYELYVTGDMYATADIVAMSDERSKENIITVDNALDKVSKLRGVYYNKKEGKDKSRKVGVVAQEVEKVLPEVVTYAEDKDEYGVNYGNIAGLLIEAIKDLKEEVKDLKQQLNNK